MSEPVWVPLGPAAPAADPGVEVAYAEITASGVVSATTAPTANTIITAPAFTADGNSDYLVEFSTPYLQSGTGALYATLWEDAVDKGILAYTDANRAVATRTTRKLRPAAGAHVYTLRAYVSAAGGSPMVGAGAGGSGAYLPASLRITKVPSGVQLPTWTPQPVVVVTALPASPVDGQEIILVDSLAAPTFSWHLKFIAAKASNKWVFVGGASSYAEVTAGEATASGTYVALGQPGPTLTLPVAGDYEVEIGFEVTAKGGAGTHFARMSYDIGATAAVDADSVISQTNATSNQGAANVMRARRKAGLGAVALTSKYRTSDTTAGMTFGNRWMRVTPVAIGG